MRTTPDSWSYRWAEIDKLRAELVDDRAARDQLNVKIAEKASRIADLAAQISDEAGLETLPHAPPDRPRAVPKEQDPPKSEDGPEKRAEPPKPGSLEGRTRKERVLRALFHLGEATVRQICDLLNDDYSKVYNALNDMRLPEKNGGRALTARSEDKKWSLTADGRKEVEVINLRAA